MRRPEETTRYKARPVSGGWRGVFSTIDNPRFNDLLDILQRRRPNNKRRRRGLETPRRRLTTTTLSHQGPVMAASHCSRQFCRCLSNATHISRVADPLHPANAMSLRAIADILDHIKPRSRGGSDAITNLRITCRFCNMAKAARLPGELLEWAGRIVAAAGEI